MSSSSLERTRELSKQLSKSTADSNVEDILSLLRQLKEVVVPSEELIRATKIGVAVGKLRTHSHARISELAKELVKSWKSQIEKQRRESPANEKSKKDAASSADTKSSSSSSSSLSSSAAPASNFSSTNSKNVDINFEVLNDRVRNACLKLLYNSLEVQDHAELKRSLHQP